jgi:hypothetical protein
MNRRCVVDEGGPAEFSGAIVGAEPGWLLVQETGTRRLDWFQANRVRII